MIAHLRRVFCRRGGTMPPPPLAADERRVLLSPGWVRLPDGAEDRYPPGFIDCINQGRRR